MSYLDYLPREIITEILYYIKSIDNRDFASLIQVYPFIKNIIKNKYFWINKLIRESLGDYTPWVDNSSIDYKNHFIYRHYERYSDIDPDLKYLDQYLSLIDISEFIDWFMKNFKNYDVILPLSIKAGSDLSKIYKDTDLNYLEDSLIMSVNDETDDYLIRHKKDDIYRYDLIKYYNNPKEFSEQQFKTLITKMVLLGINIDKESGLGQTMEEEQWADYEPDIW